MLVAAARPRLAGPVPAMRSDRALFPPPGKLRSELPAAPLLQMTRRPDWHRRLRTITPTTQPGQEHACAGSLSPTPRVVPQSGSALSAFPRRGPQVELAPHAFRQANSPLLGDAEGTPAARHRTLRPLPSYVSGYRAWPRKRPPRPRLCRLLGHTSPATTAAKCHPRALRVYPNTRRWTILATRCRYFPVNFGGRFSRNARTPSLLSAVSKSWFWSWRS